MIFQMFFNNFTHFQAFGLTGLWYQLDLRIESSLATWLESITMMFCALPCYLLATYSGKYELKKSIRIFFAAAICLSFFFSADEMLALHELIGERLQSVTSIGQGTFLEGFSWVFYYLPLMIIGLIWTGIVFLDLRKILPSNIKKKVWILLGVIAASVLAVILLEVTEAYLYTTNISSDLATSFEESFEMVVVSSFYTLLYMMYKGLTQEE